MKRFKEDLEVELEAKFSEKSWGVKNVRNALGGWQLKKYIETDDEYCTRKPARIKCFEGYEEDLPAPPPVCKIKSSALDNGIMNGNVNIDSKHYWKKGEPDSDGDSEYTVHLN